MVTVSDGAGMVLDGMSRRLRGGISFSNVLDALREGNAACRLREWYLGEVRDAGFDTFRLPVTWSAHAGESSLYTISLALFERIDWAMGEALGRDLNIVPDVHHSDELDDAPRGQQPGSWACGDRSRPYAGWLGRVLRAAQRAARRDDGQGVERTGSPGLGFRSRLPQR